MKSFVISAGILAVIAAGVTLKKSYGSNLSPILERALAPVEQAPVTDHSSPVVLSIEDREGFRESVYTVQEPPPVVPAPAPLTQDRPSHSPLQLAPPALGNGGMTPAW